MGLTHEVYAETDLGTTYRVYAEFGSATDECIALYSVGTAECVENDEDDNCIQMGPLVLELGVTTSFYQDSWGSNMGSDINPALIGFFEDLAYDSWLTIGSSSTADAAVSNAGMTSDLAEFAAGNGFVMDGMVGGSWFIIPGSNPAALAGDDGLVLLGQFTVLDEANGDPGHLSCLWNLQWRNAASISFKETGLVLNTAGSSVISGCMDATACNYNAAAEESDGNCAYATGTCDVCGGNATDGTGYVIDNDADDDGVCNVDEIAGCQIVTACNYDASATDPATCLYATGCDECGGNATDGTGYIIDNDTDNDGVCDANEIAGCQVSLACNYDVNATDPGVACIFPTGCESCSGATDGTGTVVDNDADDDGVCDANEIAGCQDSSACNYNASATDGGVTCVYPTGCESCSGATDGTGTVVDNDADDDGVCDANEIAGCQNTAACNYNVNATDAATCTYATGCDVCGGNSNDGTGYVIDNDADDDGVCDANEIAGCQAATACNYNASATDGGVTCLFATGCDVCGGNAADGTGYVIDNDADNDGVCDANEIAGCQVSTACNYNASATDGGVTCVYPTGCESCSGATDGTGTVIDNDADDDGVCDADEVAGCQDNTACNYNASATNGGVTCIYATGCETCSGATDGTGTVVDNDADDDGVCNANEIAGCQDNTACNYNASATDGGVTCIYATGCETCSGATDGTGTTVDNDSDDDGVCDADEIAGCQVPTACNYNASATDGGVTCIYATGCDYCSGATNGTGTIVNGDVDADEVCDVDEIAGCQDPVACNYNANATDSDGSCTYEVLGYDCDGNCLFDVDNDGVCDQWEITGCQDSAACNYDATATNAGYCDYPAANYDCNGDCLADADDDGVCDALEVGGCTDPTACNFAATATDDDGSCTYATAGYNCAGGCLVDSDGDGVCEQDEIAGCMNPAACNFDATATDESGHCTYPATGFDCNGDCLPGFESLCESEAPGCTFEDACNYDSAATDDDGSCMYAVSGYGCDGTCLADADNDGVCDANEVDGCTDPTACNFAAAATDEDGSCTYATAGLDCAGDCLVDSDGDGICEQDEVIGCQDNTACNYDASATDAGYCDYPATNYDCNGDCLADTDNDGVCDANEVGGCTDSTACNFAAAATDDNGSCTYAAAGYDCAGDCLVDSDGDGICEQDEVVGCQDNTACNYDASATDAGYCDFAPTGFDCDGNCLPGFESYCQGGTTTTIVVGCADTDACNYDAAVTQDNGSCTYPELGYDCDGECQFDYDGDGICNAFELPGCTDATACNYTAAATDDNGSCTYAAAGFDCAGDCLFDADEDGVCDQIEVVGCQDSAACNYDPAATEAGFCDYANAPFDCNGNCLNDADGDGVCDEFECAESEGPADCTSVEEAFLAALANGDYCGDGTVWMADQNECVPVPTCLGDFDEDGTRGTADLLILLSVFGFDCD